MGRAASNNQTQGAYLVGHLLIAMPGMQDPRFERAVIFMCAHSEEGAMGIRINEAAPQLTFNDVLEQLGIEPSGDGIEMARPVPDMPIHKGGPVETGRGFVLHSPDYVVDKSTLQIDGQVCLTATLDILRAIVDGSGPQRALLALGYAGWAPGQLEAELLANGWLHCQATPDLIFDHDLETKYERALARLGVDPRMLSPDAGHA